MAANLLGPAIRTLRKARGWTQRELSERTGIAQNTISNHENQNRTLDENDIKKYADAFGVSPKVLYEHTNLHTDTDMTMKIQTTLLALHPERQQRVYDFASDQLRQQSADENELSDNVVDFPVERNVITGRSTAAGEPIDGDAQDADAVSTVVKIEDIPHGTDEIVTVDGDSMQPDFMRGDQIYIHWQPTIDSGDLAIVRVRDEGVTFKQIMLDKRGQKIVLHSINPDYPDRRLDCDEVEVIGKVLG